jgi:hypothetical protein
MERLQGKQLEEQFPELAGEREKQEALLVQTAFDILQKDLMDHFAQHCQYFLAVVEKSHLDLAFL